jgi:hypothetical protein
MPIQLTPTAFDEIFGTYVPGGATGAGIVDGNVEYDFYSNSGQEIRITTPKRQYLLTHDGKGVKARVDEKLIFEKHAPIRSAMHERELNRLVGRLATLAAAERASATRVKVNTTRKNYEALLGHLQEVYGARKLGALAGLVEDPVAFVRANARTLALRGIDAPRTIPAGAGIHSRCGAASGG